MNRDNILEMRGISKAFGDTKALDSVDFALGKGEVHALMGENGAGKSTLVKCLIGINTLDEGEISLNGERASIKDPKDAADQGIHVVFQELSQIGTLSVAENIYLCNEMAKGIAIDRKTIFQKAEDLLIGHGIDIDPREKVENLIIAKRQMLEIMKAVAFEPKILILDEPTSSLTQAEAELLFGLIAGLKEKGISIIYISHRMDEIFRVADRITVLRDGQNVFESDATDTDFDSIVKAMVGRAVTLFHAAENRKDKVRSEEIVLQVNGIGRKGEFEDISFRLRKGEVLGFAGLIGSGRTELMLSLFGITRLDSGQVILDGKDITNLPTDKVIKAGVALVPESRHLQGLTLIHSVEENICATTLGKLCSGLRLDRRKMNRLATEMIEKFNIKTDSPGKTINLLSGGNQQKAVLSKWLATKPKVLILDEPTAGIDVQAKSDIHKLIADLIAQGTSVILISSELPELISNSDRIIILNERRIIGELKEGFSPEIIMDTIMKDKMRTA